MFYTLLQAANTAAETAEPTQQPNVLMQFLPFIIIFVIFYFLIIRPQKKKQKEHQEMIDNVQIHDKVVTNGGIIGTIVNIKKDKNIVVLRVDDSSNTKIEFQKNSISGVLNEKKKEKTSN